MRGLSSLCGVREIRGSPELIINYLRPLGCCNFGFTLREGGHWQLAPAYDVTFAMDLQNQWLSAHQMSVAGKFEDITRDDLAKVADRFSIAGVDRAIDEINAALGAWPEMAGYAGVGEGAIARIASGALRRSAELWLRVVAWGKLKGSGWRCRGTQVAVWLASQREALRNCSNHNLAS